MSKRIVLLELNEVPLIVFQRYADKSRSFRKLLNLFTVYHTRSHDNTHLSPWVTWPTVHRGVTHEKHHIDNLGQDLAVQNKEYPPIWQHLKARGLSVGVYGSLHSSQIPEDFNDYKFYVPDPFSPHSICNPQSLSSFQDFQLRLSRKSARNVSSSIASTQPITLLFTLLQKGLTIRSLVLLVLQLIHERIDKARLARRRILQVYLNFDVFKRLLYTKKPSFSTFFTNHVASSLHRYWEASYPSDYVCATQSLSWKRVYRNEISFAMKATSYIVGELVRYIDRTPESELWICTSMGQEPIQGYEAIHTQLLLTKPLILLDFLGLDRHLYQLAPAMAPRVTFSSTNRSNIDLLIQRLRGFTIHGEPLEVFSQELTTSLRVMHWNIEPDLRYYGSPVDLSDCGFEMVSIADSTGTSAYHTPNGVLMIYGPNSDRFNPSEELPTHNIFSLIDSTL